MPWMDFFTSKPSIAAGLVAFSAGSGASYALALKVANFFSGLANGLITEMGTVATSPALNLTIIYDGQEYPFSFQNISAVLPENWLHIIRSSRDIPDYAFYTVLVLGMIASGYMAWDLANSVAIYMFTKNQKRLLHVSASAGSINPPQTVINIGDDSDDDEAQRLVHY